MDWGAFLDRAAKSAGVALPVVALLLGWDYIYPICNTLGGCGTTDVILLHEVGFGWLVLNGAGASVFFLALRFVQRDKERKCYECHATLSVKKSYICPTHGEWHPTKLP